MEIGGLDMVTKKEKFDGRSRPVNDKYRDNYDSIFGKLQQEQRDLDASYRQSLRNKREREDNEEYLKEIKDKL
tara:strand:+ start:305 stop:523 length:219 start_codon:yes stop_codon:yes gene_type:complete